MLRRLVLSVCGRPFHSFFVRKLVIPSEKSNLHCWRTHNCGELKEKHIGSSVVLCGWVQYKRTDKFLLLRDWNGTVQLLCENEKLFSPISLESVLKVTGFVQARPEAAKNSKMPTGGIEIHVSQVEVLNNCSYLPLPVHEFLHKNEDTRMQYRYLDIRTSQMQKNLRTRSKMISRMREFLINSHEFVEVETPTLFRPTPGGAKEFIVPSSNEPGMFYSLPQSPQQFKQLLMVGGMDRYFQVARCYRDEGAKPDRQPEFTQLDLEMSFVTPGDVMNVTEDMIRYCWPSNLSSEKFQTMLYSDVLKRYGTDKPDLCYDMELKNVTEDVKGTSFHGENDVVNLIAIPKDQAVFLKKKVIKTIKNYNQKELHNPARIYGIEIPNEMQFNKGDIGPLRKEIVSKMGLREGDFVWIGCGKENEVQTALGNVRTQTADAIEAAGGIVKNPNKKFRFLWVVEFPMFETNDAGQLQCVHHPFTAPHPEDIHFLETEPTKVRSLAYDLVLNGKEIGGGSIRIHNSELQKRILEDFLKIDSSQLRHLLDALKTGAPPHGGIALGLDRLLAEVCDTNSIRDVIAFPKSAMSRDRMSNAPCKVDRETLEYFHISI